MEAEFKSVSETGKAGVHDGHRERLRQKFIDGGINILADHEVLELLLYYSIKRRDTNKLAHKLIREFGSFQKLLEASPAEITRHCGVSINTAVLISLCLPIYQRYSLNRWEKKIQLNASDIACEYVRDLFLNEKNECIYLICLDAHKQLIHPQLISRGTVDEAHMFPRVVLESALKHNASSVILTHNHPSGVLSASRADIEATQKLRDMLAPINIDLIDHIIVGGRSCLSFAQKQLLGLSY